MQITSTNFSPIVTKAFTYKSPVKTPTDQAQIGMSPDTFQQLVSDAKNVPEVRSEVVKDYQAKIKSGGYPSSALLDELASHLSSGPLDTSDTATESQS